MNKRQRNKKNWIEDNYNNKNENKNRNNIMEQKTKNNRLEKIKGNFFNIFQK